MSESRSAPHVSLLLNMLPFRRSLPAEFGCSSVSAGRGSHLILYTGSEGYVSDSIPEYPTGVRTAFNRDCIGPRRSGCQQQFGTGSARNRGPFRKTLNRRQSLDIVLVGFLRFLMIFAIFALSSRCRQSGYICCKSKPYTTRGKVHSPLLTRKTAKE